MAAVHPDAPVAKSAKYARIEVERRFLLERGLGTAMGDGTEICDRYIVRTRLRLRRMTSPQGVVTYKLTQKIEGTVPTERLVTTSYLNAAEYETFAALDASVITKVRHRFGPYGIDVFSGALQGLVLAELEAAPGERVMASSPVPGTIAEVTSDPRLCGGSLCDLSATELATLLLSYRNDRPVIA